MTPGNSGMGDADKVKKVAENLSKGENLSKINSFRTSFLISKASVAFIGLKKLFTKAQILHYFD